MDCFTKMNRTDRQSFCYSLLTWFARSKRDLPWRRGYEPYEVWISEIMLQQTGMERAVSYFQKWITRFPSVPAVAEADLEEVLRLWEGLGYYNRARNIHKAAGIIRDEHQGRFPEEHKAILALPGVGKYTAGAIASIAFNQDIPLVDANVERVFARVFDIDTPVKSVRAGREIANLASALLPSGRAREFNEALMELGALVCRPGRPECALCPLQGMCESHRLGIVDERPIKSKKQEITHLHVASGVLVHQGRIFIQKRLEYGAWPGLWEFPGGRIEKGETPEEAVVREFFEETEFQVVVRNPIRVIEHGYTRYRITLHTFYLSLSNGNCDPVLHAAEKYRWVRPEQFTMHAFPAGHRKLIDRLNRDKRFFALLHGS